MQINLMTKNNSIQASCEAWDGDGNDIVSAVLNLLENMNDYPMDGNEVVVCEDCGSFVLKNSSESWHGKWFGVTCGCWDERLRITG